MRTATRGVLLVKGIDRSETFRRLVDEIRQSDVIVYVDLDPSEGCALEGALQFVAKADETRLSQSVVVSEAD